MFLFASSLKKKELYFQKSIWHHIGSSRLLNMRASVFVEFPQLLFWLGFVHQSWVLGSWFGGEVKGFQTSLPSQHYQLPLHRFFSASFIFFAKRNNEKLRWIQLQTSKVCSFFWPAVVENKGTWSFKGAKTGVSWHHPKIPSKSWKNLDMVMWKQIFTLGKWVTRTAMGKKKTANPQVVVFFGGKNGYNAYFHLPFGFVFTGV